MSTDPSDIDPGGRAGPSSKGQNGPPRTADGASSSRVEDWTDGATDQAIAIAIEQRDKENPPGHGDSMSGSLMTSNDGGEDLRALER